jgi:hypothetical protein
MKKQFLATMQFAFFVKLLCKDTFFTMMPMPQYITLKGSDTNSLDIDISKDIPKDFILKFFIAKNPNALNQGDFYSVSLTKENKILLEKHNSYTLESKVLLSGECCLYMDGGQFGLSKDLVDTLNSLYEVRQ